MSAPGLDTAILRQLVDVLAVPARVALLLAAAFALVDLGLFIGETGARWWARLKGRAISGSFTELQGRIDRADLLTRVGPMLGLMGTLIPLGPGLSALGRGDVAHLASAMTVAFDTTVLGLLIGMIGFVIGRFRRRAYERILSDQESTAESPAA